MTRGEVAILSIIGIIAMRVGYVLGAQDTRHSLPMACEGSAGPVVHPTVWPKASDPIRPGTLPAAVDDSIPDSVRVGR